MRASLSVKLTITSTLLVAIIVAFLGYTHAVSIREEHDAWAKTRTETFKSTVLSQAESAAGVIAVTVSEHLIGTELEPLDLVARRLVKEDPRILVVRIANARGDVLADSTKKVETAELAKLPGEPATWLAASANETTLDGKRVLVVRRPIHDPDGALKDAASIGAVDFTYDLSALDQALADIEVQRKEAISRSLSFTLKIGIVALLIGALLSLVQGLRYARPIKKLALTTSRIAQGDLGARVDVRKSDEIGALGVQFNHMADRIQQLLTESVAKAELEHELALAREIQSVLVPGPGNHAAPGIEVAGYYEPAFNVGGDFWDLSALPRGRSAILIGDVTGHGVPASILTATAKGCLDTLRHVHGGDMQVAETMRVLDRVIHDAGHGAFFMTATAIVLDATENALYYSAAAHPPGVLLRWTESGVKVSRLAARGNRLGDGDAAGFEAKRIRVVKDDLLVWYTDGLVDAVNDEGRQYTTRQLLHVLGQLDPREVRPEDVVRKVTLDLARFRGQVPLADDVTLVVGRVA
ncbi:MAG: SpoIIE family protein phosphatase [Deltaproteobacteria bacterium]|nr:SpoIIE family protein phosphatase [Deltaproteobacteria bacterium]